MQQMILKNRAKQIGFPTTAKTGNNLRSLRDKVDLARILVDDYRNGIDPFQEKED